MQYEEFEAIMEENIPRQKFEDNKIFAGLVIMRKYIQHCGIDAAEHDIVYSTGVEKLLDAGLTEDDARELNRLGWFIENGECLAHYA